MFNACTMLIINEAENIPEQPSHQKLDNQGYMKLSV